jgi:hypothetical protein
MGIKAARRAIKSNGSKMTWVVPSSIGRLQLVAWVPSQQRYCEHSYASLSCCVLSLLLIHGLLQVLIDTVRNLRIDFPGKVTIRNEVSQVSRRKPEMSTVVGDVLLD